ncbi:hypothetical protein FGB62_37g415 [Gracilaria domingensis]|nr:hypothetical protein FGB62_37g415 [Gracilaria domingensis]
MLIPHALQIDRDGYLVVKMKASVVSSESLAFTVLRKNMQLALDTLDVVDSRGTLPFITFGSPIYFDGEKDRSEQAWDIMLREARGARVHVEFEDGSADGTLMGIQKDFAVKSEDVCSMNLVVLSDGEVTVHRVDTIRSLSFLDEDVTDRLKRESLLINSAVDTLRHYRVVIIACGQGEGLLNVCYGQRSPYYPAFEIFYAVDDTPEENGCRRTKCFFTIRDPLHFDITDVEVQLQSGIQRRRDYRPAYCVEDLKSSSSDGSPERTVLDDDEEFDHVSSESTTSGHTLYGHGNHIYNINEKLSLKEGQSVRIFHSEIGIRSEEMSSYGANWTTKVVNSQYIQNVNGDFLAAGTWYWNDRETKTNRIFYYSDIAGHPEFANYMTWSALPRCRSVKQRVHEVGRAIRSEIMANTLRVSYEWNVTTTYRFRNQSKLEFSMFLIHESVVSSRRRSHIEATVQYIDEDTHSGEEGSKLELSPSGFKLGVRYFMVKVASFKETVVIVKEESTPDCPLHRQ